MLLLERVSEMPFQRFFERCEGRRCDIGGIIVISEVVVPPFRRISFFHQREVEPDLFLVISVDVFVYPEIVLAGVNKVIILFFVSGKRLGFVPDFSFGYCSH